MLQRGLEELSSPSAGEGWTQVIDILGRASPIDLHSERQETAAAGEPRCVCIFSVLFNRVGQTG